MLVLAGCGNESGDFGRPRENRAEPVDLVLLENGRPDPSVLADEQVVYRGNGDEPETLDPHRADFELCCLSDGIVAGAGEDVDVGLEDTEQDGIFADFFGKPPAVLGFHHAGGNPGRQFGFLLDFSARRFDDHPLAIADAQWTGGIGIDFRDGVGLKFAKRADLAVLGVVHGPKPGTGD